MFVIPYVAQAESASLVTAAAAAAASAKLCVIIE